MNRPFRALIVDDEDLYAQAVAREISRNGISCDLAFNCREALGLAGNRQYGVILLDQQLPDDDGINIIPQLRVQQPGAALVMMTAYQTIPNAVRAIRHGAEDYIVKQASVAPILERVLDLRKRVRLREEAHDAAGGRCCGLLGRSAAIRAVVDELGRVAAARDTTLLLTGETGVGKEVACRFVHSLSRAAGSPLVVVDCLALPDTLAESLLFGHQRGAFTGAQEAQAGAFEEARDGTAFIDEIGDLAASGQGKLLRVLESRTFRRLGSSREIPLRARVVAATNRDLAAMVQAGSFRHDLFQRLSVFPVHIPPLRERGDDIILLAEHFRVLFGERLNKPTEPLSPEVSEALLRYQYPGNVRELKNIIERAVILTTSACIELRHLPERMLAGGPRELSLAAPPPGEVEVRSLADAEERLIRDAMRRAGNVRSEAARLLGISRFQLRRRMQKFGIGVPPERA